MPQTTPSFDTKLASARRFKATDQATGRFEGYLAVFNNVDRGNDVIVRGAFAQTIEDAKTSAREASSQYLWPLLWQHDQDDPVGGIVSAQEDSYGLFIVGQCDLDIDQGRRAYSAISKGYASGLSIGYDVVKSAWDKAGIRQLLQIRLWEGSVVTFPMNELAVVQETSSMRGSRSSTQMAQLQERLEALGEQIYRETGDEAPLLAAKRALGQAHSRSALSAQRSALSAEERADREARALLKTMRVTMREVPDTGKAVFHVRPGPNSHSDDPYRDESMHQVGTIFSSGWYWLD